MPRWSQADGYKGTNGIETAAYEPSAAAFN